MAGEERGHFGRKCYITTALYIVKIYNTGYGIHSLDRVRYRVPYLDRGPVPDMKKNMALETSVRFRYFLGLHSGTTVTSGAE
jgi:hypothetical protein